MKKEYITILILFSMVFFSCEEEKTSTKEIKKDTAITITTPKEQIPAADSMHEGFSIENTTSFKVTELLYARGEEYESPEGKYYYGIGRENIYITPGTTPKLHIPQWDILLKNDTAIFKSRKSKVSQAGNPVASINYFGVRYEGVNREYSSKNFGEIILSETGYSCDDSYEGKVLITDKDNKTLTVKGLANVDVFENSDQKELYIISYHNCLSPGLRIIRVSF